MSKDLKISAPPLSRRAFLRASLGVACSAAAAPLATPMAFAASPGENRLVVIVLRGGLDGLDSFIPYGDPNFAALRPNIGESRAEGLIDLDGFYGLNPAFSGLQDMWRAGELAALHATSTPYRDARSHFDGQDVLESGGLGEGGDGLADGWLNRALSVIPGAPAAAEVRYAMAVGHRNMLILAGDEPSGSWAPSNRLSMEDDERRLLEMLYQDDPLFHAAASEAFLIGEATMEARERKRYDRGGDVLARFTAEMLKSESRIASFSISGWDTHRDQLRSLNRPANNFTEALVTLKSELGPLWEKTTVIAMTEFGRTARENGARGTDHGTGGVMLLAGGAVRGGKVYNGVRAEGAGFAGWPGLQVSDLYEERDLRPTEDLRRVAAWSLATLFGAARSDLERVVFPGLDMGPDPRVLL